MTDPARIAEEPPDFDDIEDTCANCGGEGFVANCWEEYACVDPEYGCELCMVPCDWCRPVRNHLESNNG